jgi:quercetin dioxygenase-like cupin family protein
MRHLKLGDIAAREIVPGAHARFVHSMHTTLAYWDFDPGTVVPEHAHQHEQTVNLLEGKFNLIVDGELLELETGSVVLIPSNVPHSGKAVTKCRILDVFFPVREDYR